MSTYGRPPVPLSIIDVIERNFLALFSLKKSNLLHMIAIGHTSMRLNSDLFKDCKFTLRSGSHPRLRYLQQSYYRSYFRKYASRIEGMFETDLLTMEIFFCAIWPR